MARPNTTYRNHNIVFFLFFIHATSKTKTLDFTHVRSLFSPWSCYLFLCGHSLNPFFSECTGPLSMSTHKVWPQPSSERLLTGQDKIPSLENPSMCNWRYRVLCVCISSTRLNSLGKLRLFMKFRPERTIDIYETWENVYLMATKNVSTISKQRRWVASSSSSSSSEFANDCETECACASWRQRRSEDLQPQSEKLLITDRRRRRSEDLLRPW